MNVALGSIILFLVLLPGIVFRNGYLSSIFSRKVIDRNPLDDIFFAIVPAIVFHLIWLLIVNSGIICFLNVQVDLEFLLKLTASDEKIQYTPISQFVFEIFIYNISLIGTAFLAGHFCRWLVRQFKWDRTTRLFRFSNKWHYVFSGEILDFPDIPDTSDDVDHIHIDILSDVSGKMIIYSGEYLTHSLNSEGELDSITLRHPSKKEFNSNSDFIDIPSKFFFIPYSTVKNLNVRYFAVEEATEEEVEEYENKINEDQKKTDSLTSIDNIEDA